jgi:glycosyltransferase involved in cell wall biosynthesis
VKIAVIAPTQIPARRANTIQVMKMTQALAETGHQVELLVPGADLEPFTSWEELAHFYGLKTSFPVRWMPARPSLRKYDFGWETVRWARGWEAGLVYTRLPQAAAFASRSGMSTIFETHEPPQGTMGPLFMRLFLAGKGARRLVVISQALAEDLAKGYVLPQSPGFIKVAPDGVDLERYAGLPDPEEARQRLIREGKARLEPQRFTAGYTGHLYPGRGKGLILEMAARLPEVQFLLVGGEPPDVEALRAEAQDRGLENVIVVGFVPNAELPRYQAACEALLMPYQRQVAGSSGGDIARYLSPMKLFEYLACGRAILCSDLAVFREVLSDEQAILLPPEDAGAWVEALGRLQSDLGLRASLGENARQTARKHTWTQRAERILDGLA